MLPCYTVSPSPAFVTKVELPIDCAGRRCSSPAAAAEQPVRRRIQQAVNVAFLPYHLNPASRAVQAACPSASWCDRRAGRTAQRKRAGRGFAQRDFRFRARATAQWQVVVRACAAQLVHTPRQQPIPPISAESSVYQRRYDKSVSETSRVQHGRSSSRCVTADGVRSSPNRWQPADGTARSSPQNACFAIKASFPSRSNINFFLPSLINAPSAVINT